MTQPPTETGRKPKQPFQFGVRSLMLIMLLASFVAAVGAPFLRAAQEGAGQQLPLLLCAAPMAAMILISVWASVNRYLRRRAKRNAKRDPLD